MCGACPVSRSCVVCEHLTRGLGMESVQWSGRSPIAVAVMALFSGVLGMLSLSRLPLQLFPDINRPEISIQCPWRTASPEEVESELLVPLEYVLQGMAGVEEVGG